jgi:hypothetical protein
VTVVHPVRLLHTVSLFKNILDDMAERKLTVDAQREVARLKAAKEEQREVRKKRALQKANQQAGIEPNSEDEFQVRPNPSVGFIFFHNKPHSESYHQLMFVVLIP